MRPQPGRLCMTLPATGISFACSLAASIQLSVSDPICVLVCLRHSVKVD